MFTGIVEELAKVKAVREEGTNRIFEISARFDEPIRVDQSIAHNGACLTVTEIFEQSVDQQVRYSVTAVEETLLKTDLGKWQPGSLVNLERCLRVGDRLDGHFVQGHVDAVGTVVKVENREGSWNYEFSFDPGFSGLLVDKGSICVNGVSLTVVKSWEGGFTVTIIPFTYEQTTFQELKVGDWVNLEFDILGKYLLKNHKV